VRPAPARSTDAPDPFSPRGRRWREAPDEGGRAERDGLAKHGSIRHCVADPRDRQFRRRNYKRVRQPENPKSLIAQPGVTAFVGKALRRDIVTWPVNLDNQSMLEADKINDIIA